MAKGRNAVQNSISYELIFGLLAIMSLVLLVYEVSVPLSASERTLINAVDLFTVIIFAVDYALGFYWASNKRAYFWENWYNLLATVPFTSGPFRAFRLFRLFRLSKLSYLAASKRERNGSHLAEQVRSFANLATFAVVSIMAGSIAFYSVEQVANPKVQSYGDAVYWAVVTATSIGYGDVVPQTLYGRIVAIMLMIVSVGIIGTIAGLVGGYVLRRPLFKYMAQRSSKR